MKKKILLMLSMLALLVCIFAISVSATAINKDTTVTLDGTFTVGEKSVTNPVVNLYDADGDALIWYLNTDGKLVSAKVASVVTVNSEGVISFTDQSIFLNKTPRKSVIAVNLRDNVKVSGSDINWDGQIKHFDDSKGTDNDTGIASTGFQFGTYSDSGFTIQYFYFPTSTESTVKRMFQGAPVKVADFEPGTNLNKMGMLAFYGASKLTEIYIPNNLAVFPGGDGQGLFQNCSSLSEVTFEENSILWDAGQCTFYGCSSLKELYLPNSVKTFGSEFARHSGIEIFSFGAGFEYFTRRDPNKDPDSSHMWVFYGTGLKKVYMPASFAILNDEYDFDDYTSADERLDTFDRIFSNAGSFTLFFTGTKEEIEALKTRMSYTQENQSIVSSLNNIYSYEEYVAAGSPSGSCAVYGYSQCDAFYNGVHDNETVIKYEAFYKEGEKIVGCTKCDQNEKTTLPALFTCLGTSASEINGSYGIAVGFKVNFEAIENYTALTGKTVSYGVFAATQEKLGANEIFDENGKMTEGVLGTEIKTSHSAFEIKITGIPEAQKATKLSLGGYVKTTDGDKVEYSYMQDPEVGTQTGNYRFVSYNNVVGE